MTNTAMFACFRVSPIHAQMGGLQSDDAALHNYSDYQLYPPLRFFSVKTYFQNPQKATDQLVVL